MMPSKGDSALVTGLVISGIALLAGYLANQLVWAAVGSILLTGLVTLGINQLMQKNIRKYQKANLAVRRVFGPIHSDLLTIKQNLENDKRGFLLSDPYSGISNWPQICYDYRGFLIPKDKKEELAAFFQSVREYVVFPGRATTRITLIASSIAEREFGFKDFMNILFRVKEDNGTIMDVAQGNGGWWWGLVFWHIKPSESVKQYGELFEGTLENRGKGVQRIPANKTDEFIVMCMAGADKDPVISEAKKKRRELETNVEKLLTVVRIEIEGWAKA